VLLILLDVQHATLLVVLCFDHRRSQGGGGKGVTIALAPWAVEKQYFFLIRKMGDFEKK